MIIDPSIYMCMRMYVSIRIFYSNLLCASGFITTRGNVTVFTRIIRATIFAFFSIRIVYNTAID